MYGEINFDCSRHLMNFDSDYIPCLRDFVANWTKIDVLIDELKTGRIRHEIEKKGLSDFSKLNALKMG